MLPMKLSTLATPLTLSAMLALAGCKKKEQPAAPPPTSTSAPAAPTEPAANRGAPGAPESAPPVETAPPEAMPGVPPACADYKAGIERLTTCENLPAETREVLKQAFDQAAAGWAKDPDKAAVADACQRAADALKQLDGACS